jgi:hypothetical protein
LDFTILGGRHRQNTEAYLAREGLTVDFGGQSREYNLVVTCTDLIIQKNLRGKPIVLVQEGMTEREGFRYWLARYAKFPRFLADTAGAGLSDAYDLFCVVSPGYRDLFIRKGVRPEKIRVTGIPNFDNAQAYRKNDFPHQNFVLAATSSTRETLKFDNRQEFIRQVKQIAADRKIIFKLHPNENFERSRKEILLYAPEALVPASGNVNHMIANCDVLVTHFSSVVYIGLALGKEVYSYFDPEMLRRLTPIQNGGTSARRIADLCRQLIESPQADIARNPRKIYRGRD